MIRLELPLKYRRRPQRYLHPAQPRNLLALDRRHLDADPAPPRTGTTSLLAPWGILGGREAIAAMA